MGPMSDAHRTKRVLPGLAWLRGRSSGLNRAALGTDNPNQSAPGLAPMLARRVRAQIGALGFALLWTAALPASAYGQVVAPGQVETSGGAACAEIHAALDRLAAAERRQALALELYSRGGELPMVETRFQQLQQASADLREILRRVHAGRIAREPSVAECLEVGYKVLFTADRVISEVERVLIEARGKTTRDGGGVQLARTARRAEPVSATVSGWAAARLLPARGRSVAAAASINSRPWATRPCTVGKIPSTLTVGT